MKLANIKNIKINKTQPHGIDTIEDFFFRSVGSVIYIKKTSVGYAPDNTIISVSGILESFEMEFCFKDKENFKAKLIFTGGKTITLDEANRSYAFKCTNVTQTVKFDQFAKLQVRN